VCFVSSSLKDSGYIIAGIVHLIYLQSRKDRHLEPLQVQLEPMNLRFSRWIAVNKWQPAERVPFACSVEGSFRGWFRAAHGRVMMVGLLAFCIQNVAMLTDGSPWRRRRGPPDEARRSHEPGRCCRVGDGQWTMRQELIVLSSRGRWAADDARRAGGGRRDKGRRKDSTTNLPSCGG